MQGSGAASIRSIAKAFPGGLRYDESEKGSVGSGDFTNCTGHCTECKPDGQCLPGWKYGAKAPTVKTPFTFVRDPLEHFLAGAKILGAFQNVRAFGTKHMRWMRNYARAHVEHVKDSHNLDHNCHEAPQLWFLMNTMRAGTPLKWIGDISDPRDYQEFRTLSPRVPAEMSHLHEIGHKRMDGIWASVEELAPEVVGPVCASLYWEYRCLSLPFPRRCRDENGEYNLTQWPIRNW